MCSGFKFRPDGIERLTTQLYLKGDPYIADDPYVRDDLIIDFTESDGALLGAFEFVLG